jgi:hypothetical protein
MPAISQQAEKSVLLVAGGVDRGRVELAAGARQERVLLPGRRCLHPAPLGFPYTLLDLRGNPPACHQDLLRRLGEIHVSR